MGMSGRRKNNETKDEKINPIIEKEEKWTPRPIEEASPTIIELKKYCDQDNPVGAILLTGEWGSGKTYIVENELGPFLNRRSVILRISLFGIVSIEQVHEAVTSLWMANEGGFLQAFNKLGNLLKKVGEFAQLTPLDFLKNAKDVHFNPVVNISNTIKDMPVILIFDDLERSKLDTIDILGAINEYCENKHFYVIIIADEDKLDGNNNHSKENNTNMSYKEIKEKVIQRTVYHEPTYDQIIQNIINQISDEEYKTFLQSNQEELTALFAGRNKAGKPLDEESQKYIIQKRSLFSVRHISDEEQKNALELAKKRPHNIRSLKIAIKEFENVYKFLCKHKVNELGPWLLSFVAFSMANRANLLKDGNETDKVGLWLYPGFFSSSSFPKPLRDWVVDGKWSENDFVQYLENVYPSAKNSSSELAVQTLPFPQLKASVIRENLPKLLDKAALGQLELSEYILLIQNIRNARTVHFDLPDIDWKKIQEGINKKEKEMIDNCQDLDLCLDENLICTQRGFSCEEVETYNIIYNIKKGGSLTNAIEKNKYINGLVENPSLTIMRLLDTKLHYFDSDMADETFNAYDNADIEEKTLFVVFLPTLLDHLRKNQDISQETKDTVTEALSDLHAKLSELEVKYQEEPFEKHSANAFMKSIAWLIEKFTIPTGSLSEEPDDKIIFTFINDQLEINPNLKGQFQSKGFA